MKIWRWERKGGEWKGEEREKKEELLFLGGEKSWESLRERDERAKSKHPKLKS